MDGAYSVYLHGNNLHSLICQPKLSMELVDCPLWVKITGRESVVSIAIHPHLHLYPHLNAPNAS